MHCRNIPIMLALAPLRNSPVTAKSPFNAGYAHELGAGRQTCTSAYGIIEHFSSTPAHERIEHVNSP